MNKHQNQFTKARAQCGLSLIELMVALALGLLVIAAMIQLFAGNRATFASNEALGRVQENGRFSMEIIKRELRSGNFYGTCAAQIPVRNHLRTDCGDEITEVFDDDRAIIGWEFLGTGVAADYDALTDESDLIPSAGNLDRWRSTAGANHSLPAFLDGRVVPGSDVILIRVPEPVPGITQDGTGMAASDSTIDLSANSTLETGQIVLTTNCSTGADLFHNRSGSTQSELTASAGTCSTPGPGNRGLNWSTAYNDTMQIFRVRVIAFYIGYNTTTGEPGLYRADLSRGISNAVHEELVGGVESMQVLYGYSSPAPDGDGQSVDFWISGDQVPDWDYVIGTRIALLVRSSENMGAGVLRRTFDLAGTAFTHPQDGRLRQPFFASISLRNQQLVL